MHLHFHSPKTQFSKLNKLNKPNETEKNYETPTLTPTQTQLSSQVIEPKV